MTDIFERNLVPSKSTLSSRVGNETVILQLKKGTYFGLDPMATSIWNMLKEGLDPAQICAHIILDYDVAPEVIEADVRNFLTELEANAIIEGGEQPAG